MRISLWIRYYWNKLLYSLKLKKRKEIKLKDLIPLFYNLAILKRSMSIAMNEMEKLE